MAAVWYFSEKPYTDPELDKIKAELKALQSDWLELCTMIAKDLGLELAEDRGRPRYSCHFKGVGSDDEDERG